MSVNGRGWYLWNNQWWTRHKIVYLCKWESHKALSWTSQKSQREVKMKQYLCKGYAMKGEIWVQQNEQGDHTVIKSLKDTYRIETKCRETSVWWLTIPS